MHPVLDYDNSQYGSTLLSLMLGLLLSGLIGSAILKLQSNTLRTHIASLNTIETQAQLKTCSSFYLSKTSQPIDLNGIQTHRWFNNKAEFLKFASSSIIPEFTKRIADKTSAILLSIELAPIFLGSNSQTNTSIIISNTPKPDRVWIAHFGLNTTYIDTRKVSLNQIPIAADRTFRKDISLNSRLEFKKTSFKSKIKNEIKLLIKDMRLSYHGKAGQIYSSSILSNDNIRVCKEGTSLRRQNEVCHLFINKVPKSSLTFTCPNGNRSNLERLESVLIW